MSTKFKYSRRNFLSDAFLNIAAAELGILTLAGNPLHDAGPATSKMGTVKTNEIYPFDKINQLNAGVLNVGYVDAGPADGPVVLLIHGWPYDIHSFEEVTPILLAKGYRVIIPYLRGYGSTTFISRQTLRNGQQSAIALDMIMLMDELKIEKAILAGFDWGARTVDVMAVLWPERCKAIVAVSGYIITNLKTNKQPLPPKNELVWWYQYYFATERGRAGYEKYRHDFAKLIWSIASPKWNFDDATFNRSAAALDNSDHVDIVIHNYRWRQSLADGERQYDEMEKKLAQAPFITVPAITIGSDFDGAAADGKSYAGKFTGKYSHKILDDIGHNVPQEAPQEFANAIIEVNSFTK